MTNIKIQPSVIELNDIAFVNYATFTNRENAYTSFIASNVLFNEGFGLVACSKPSQAKNERLFLNLAYFLDLLYTCDTSNIRGIYQQSL